MAAPNPESDQTTVLMNAESVGREIDRIASEIVSTHQEVSELGLLGILRRGRPLADRIAERITALSGQTPLVGSLSTALYRDDVRSRMSTSAGKVAETHFDFDVTGREIVLVDDVLASGRTVRAALDEVMDYGRPSRIQLACLVDRGLRELPIQPDYLGLAEATRQADHVSVLLEETDGEDKVVLERG